MDNFSSKYEVKELLAKAAQAQGDVVITWSTDSDMLTNELMFTFGTMGGDVTFKKLEVADDAGFTTNVQEVTDADHGFKNYNVFEINATTADANTVKSYGLQIGDKVHFRLTVTNANATSVWGVHQVNFKRGIQNV